MSKLWIAGGLQQVWRGTIIPGKIADQVQMLAVVGSNGKGLLHEPIRLISIAIRATVRICFVALHTIAIGILLHSASTSLPFHLAIRQETSTDTACAPGLAISPASHARLSLVPYEHRARFDRLTFLLR